MNYNHVLQLCSLKHYFTPVDKIQQNKGAAPCTHWEPEKTCLSTFFLPIVKPWIRLRTVLKLGMFKETQFLNMLQPIQS